MPSGSWACPSGSTRRRVLPRGLGEHTDAILTEIGYGPEEIARFRAVGAVR